jgi:hypothetical protein
MLCQQPARTTSIKSRPTSGRRAPPLRQDVPSPDIPWPC